MQTSCERSLTIFTLTQMWHSSSILNLTASLLSPWPSVLPLGLPHLSSPQNQSWAVCAPWSGVKLLSASRADQPWPCIPLSMNLLSCPTEHFSIHDMNDGVSMNKMRPKLETWQWFLLCYWSNLDMWTLSGPAVSVWVLFIPLSLSIWHPVYYWAKTLTLRYRCSSGVLSPESCPEFPVPES